jgi:hypothetical protein
MTTIETRHIQRTITFLTEKSAEYFEQAASYKRQDFEALGNWYEGRAAAFAAAAEYVQTDLDIFAEEAAQ